MRYCITSNSIFFISLLKLFNYFIETIFLTNYFLRILFQFLHYQLIRLGLKLISFPTLPSPLLILPPLTILSSDLTLTNMLVSLIVLLILLTRSSNETFCSICLAASKTRRPCDTLFSFESIIYFICL